MPHEWLVERGRYWLTRWQSLTDDAENAAFMVLTACRIWRFAADGVHCAKADAARWALARTPELSAVRQALADGGIDPADLAAVLDTVLRETG